MPSAIPCIHSPLISHIHSSLFWDWMCTVTFKFFDAQVLSVSNAKLVLHRHARCVFSHLRCNGHSLLLSSYLSRIGRIENSCCSAPGHSSLHTSHLILHCPATDSLLRTTGSLRRSLFGDSLSLYDLWFRPLELAGFWGFTVLRHVPIPRKGRVITRTGIIFS